MKKILLMESSPYHYKDKELSHFIPNIVNWVELFNFRLSLKNKTPQKTEKVYKEISDNYQFLRGYGDFSVN